MWTQNGHITILVFKRFDSGYFSCRAFRIFMEGVCVCAHMCVCVHLHTYICVYMRLIPVRHIIITIPIPTSEQPACPQEGFFTLLRASVPLHSPRGREWRLQGKWKPYAVTLGEWGPRDDATAVLRHARRPRSAITAGSGCAERLAFTRWALLFQDQRTLSVAIRLGASHPWISIWLKKWISTCIWKFSWHHFKWFFENLLSYFIRTILKNHVGCLFLNEWKEFFILNIGLFFFIGSIHCKISSARWLAFHGLYGVF